jgi:hypothetical protein
MLANDKYKASRKKDSVPEFFYLMSSRATLHPLYVGPNHKDGAAGM